MQIPEASLHLGDVFPDPRMAQLHRAWWCFALTILEAFHGHWLTLPVTLFKVQVTGEKSARGVITRDP